MLREAKHPRSRRTPISWQQSNHKKEFLDAPPIASKCKGSFDCVAARHAARNFAQDDKAVRSTKLNG
jgi:hypothetical protein